MGKTFKELVYESVEELSEGEVVSYGELAAICGRPRAARVVGQIARFGPRGLPWHRVVYSDGRLARRFPNGGRDEQKRLLLKEGVEIENYRVVSRKE